MLKDEAGFLLIGFVFLELEGKNREHCFNLQYCKQLDKHKKGQFLDVFKLISPLIEVPAKGEW